MPRRRHLKGGWLHRLLGERLFAPELWRFSKHEVAAGLALGLFIGFTPTMGVQFFLTVLAAYFLRVNIPVALAGVLVTNPVTAPIIYPLEYQIGIFLAGPAEPAQLEGGKLIAFLGHAKPLWAGSLVVAIAMAVAGYGAVRLLWARGASVGVTANRCSSKQADTGNL